MRRFFTFFRARPVRPARGGVGSTGCSDFDGSSEERAWFGACHRCAGGMVPLHLGMVWWIGVREGPRCSRVFGRRREKCRPSTDLTPKKPTGMLTGLPSLLSCARARFWSERALDRKEFRSRGQGMYCCDGSRFWRRARCPRLEAVSVCLSVEIPRTANIPEKGKVKIDGPKRTAEDR